MDKTGITTTMQAIEPRDFSRSIFSPRQAVAGCEPNFFVVAESRTAFAHTLIANWRAVNWGTTVLSLSAQEKVE